MLWMQKKSPSNHKSIAYEWQENFLPEYRQCYHNIVTCNSYGYKIRLQQLTVISLTFFLIVLVSKYDKPEW